jgi:hypothetical protein
MRLAVPAGVLIVLMAAMMIAFAVGTRLTPHPGSSGGGIHRIPNLPSPTTGVAPMPTPPSSSTQVITPIVTVTTHPKGTLASKSSRYIFDCTPETQAGFYYLAICGKNFRAGAKVILFEADASGQAVPVDSMPVGSSGTFSDWLPLPSCGDGPVTIYAKEISGRRSVVSNALTVTVQGCDFPTSQLTLRKGGH